MAKGIDDVRQRLERAAGALARHGVDYAVVGGNAVAAWVSRADESAVRNTSYFAIFAFSVVKINVFQPGDSSIGGL
jgi:hypothetical protein